MKRKSSSPIATDLILEILSRLPSKSVARFHCVSKQWASMFGSPYFRELFLTRSSAKPRLLFAIVENGDENAKPEGCGVWSFFSSPQLEHPYVTSSSTLVAAADFHVRFSPKDLKINYDDDARKFSFGYASGLFYIYGDRYQARPLICNPVTGRYAITPKRYPYRNSAFGFDPVDKQYKALSMAYPTGYRRSKIRTFEDGDLSWRNIKSHLPYEIMSDGVCINGVLYYLGDMSYWVGMIESVEPYMIVCFDVRSETFTFIAVERFCELINYKGKLAVVFWEHDDNNCFDGEDLDKYLEDGFDVDTTTNELHVWVLEDVEKQEWSKYSYTCTDDKLFLCALLIVGATPTGEIVFSMPKYKSETPFYVFYFSPERNTLQRVEIQGFGKAFKEPCTVLTFLNHVEDLNVNDLKLLKSSHPPLVDPGYEESSHSSDSSDSD